jgi:hypothetical protein
LHAAKRILAIGGQFAKVTFDITPIHYKYSSIAKVVPGAAAAESASTFAR